MAASPPPSGSPSFSSAGTLSVSGPRRAVEPGLVEIVAVFVSRPVAHSIPIVPCTTGTAFFTREAPGARRTSNVAAEPSSATDGNGPAFHESRPRSFFETSAPPATADETRSESASTPTMPLPRTRNVTA